MRFVGLAALAALGMVVPASADALPGQAIFEKTCKSCHGPEGKGDPAMDRFWKVKIPRLTSKYVQQKSDEELKKIVTGGIRKMEPVRMDAPTGPHRVKLQSRQVDEVITYVRTLKAE